MPRICHRHGSKVSISGECPKCVAELETPRPVESMSPEERVAEFESWGGVPEVNGDRMFPRLEDLVGRAIYPHEYGFNWEGLKAEILGSKPHPEFLDEITACLPRQIKVVVFDLSQPSTTVSDN